MVFRDIDKQAIVENKARILSKIIIDGIELNEDNCIVEWEYEDYRYVPENGFIGQFVERILDGKLRNLPDDLNLADKDFNLQLGIVNGIDNKTTYYSYGNFLITKVGEKDTTGMVSFESADYTKKFNQIYVDSVNYPCTALELAQNVCAQVGVELGSTNFINKDFVIENNQFVENTTCRDVMKAIGQLAYSWVRVGVDNKVYIDFEQKAQNTVETYNNITTDDYYETTKDFAYYGPVNKVVVGMSQLTGENVYVEDTSIGSEVCTINVYDNPLTYTEELRRKVIEGAKSLFGLTYIPLTAQTTGHPWLEGDDIISIKVLDDTTLYSYPFDRKLTYKGYIKSELSSKAKSGINTEYDYNSEINKKLSNVEIIVDKNGKKITALASDVDQLELDTTTTKQAQGNPIEVTDAGEYLLESIGIDGKSEQDTRSGKNLWKLPKTQTLNGVTLTNNGDGTITLNGTATANADFYAIDDASNYTNGEKYYISSNINKSDVTLLIANYNGDTYANTMINSNQTMPFTMNTTNDQVRLIIRALSGKTFNNTKLQIQMEKGSTATNWEPYGASPSPDYPSEIKSVKGIRNLFYGDLFDGYLNYGLVSDSTWKTTDYLEVESNKEYIFHVVTAATRLLYEEYTTKDVSGRIGSRSETKPNTSIKTKETTKYIRFSLNDTNLDKSTMMLEEGSIAHDYVPYGSWLQVKDTGKNKFNPNERKNNVVPSVSSGIDVSVNSSFSSDYIKVNDIAYFKWSTGAQGYLFCYDENYNHLGNKGSIHGKISSSEINTNTKYVRIRFDTSYSEDLKIIVSNEDVSYEPYKENTALIDMNKYDEEGNITGYHEFVEIGDTKDTFLNGLLTQKILKVVLDGSETHDTWSVNKMTYGYAFDIGNPLASIGDNSKITLLSDKFKASTFNDRNNGDVNIIYGYSGDSRIRILTNVATTVNEWKTWLSNNPVTVYYVLAEPQAYKLSYEPLKLFKGYNNITLNDELLPNMNIEYLTDSKLNAQYTTKAELQIESDNITQTVRSDLYTVNNNIGTLNDSVTTIQTNVSKLIQNADNLQIDITNTTTLLNQINNSYVSQDDLKDMTVTEVTTTTGYKLDKDGFKVSKTGANTSTLINEKGLDVSNSSNQSILYAGYDENLGDTVLKTNNLILNDTSRFENYVDSNNSQAVGCFWTGG